MDFDIDKERINILLLLTDLATMKKLSEFSRYSGINYRTLTEIRYNKCKPKFETIQKIKAAYQEFADNGN